MSYRALYRKYRPDTFDEMIGQDHVVITLQNEIKADRIAHAYLFTGTRGTGKTSAAKIFAKAVNCENPEDGNPCGQCPACRAIADGRSLNVIEIDAASNNGVDNIRQIREEVAYSPTEGKYKVYIIDEVHMLSPSAFNALLKTLEEPPSYVIFILATTDVQKIPVTILSRCQRFDFHRISQDEITTRLSALLKREGIEAQEKAVRYIARKAEGGMRDALSLADQCISFYLGESLTYDHVLGLLGAVDTERLDGLYRAVCAGEVADVFRRLEEMIRDGKDIVMIAADLTEHVRNILLMQAADGAEDILDVSEENMALLREDAASASASTLMRYVRVLSETLNALRYAVNKRVVLETTLIRLSRPQMEGDLTSLTERIRQIEEQLSSGTITVSASSGAGSAPAGGGASPVSSPKPQEKRPAAYAKAVPEDLQRVRNEWQSIIDGLEENGPRFALRDVEISFDPQGNREGEIYIAARTIGGSRYARDAGIEQSIEQLIESRLHKTIHVHLLGDDEQDGSGRARIDEKKAVDAAAKAGILMDIEYE